MAHYTITEERIVPIASPHEFLDRAFNAQRQKCEEVRILRRDVDRLLARISALQGVQ
jgi:hypothetical protein